MPSMAAAARVAVRVKHWPVNLGAFDTDEDPYNRLTSKFPAESDRILDDVLGKLMLDGWVYNHAHTLLVARIVIPFGAIRLILNNFT